MAETLYEVVEYAKQSLEEFVRDNPDASYGMYDDAIFEIADGAVPVYTYDLLAVAQSDLWLATTEPDIGVGEPTASACISANIYDHVSQELRQYLEELLETIKDEQEDEDDEG